MCRAKILLFLGFTILYSQANDTPSNYDEFYYPKQHLSSLARDGLLPDKRYVASLMKNNKPSVYFQPEIKKFSHPFHVFQKEPQEDKRFIGTVLAKSGQGKFMGDKRSLMDGMIFGEDMRRYINSNSDKKSDYKFSDDMDVLLGSDRDKKYGVDGMVFGEDFRRFYNPYDLQKRSFGVDGLIFGEDMRRLQNYPEEEKRGFNSLMDQMVLGEDLRNDDSYDKRGYSLMDGMVFGEDLRNKVLQNFNKKRGHSLMDGMVFAEDLRKAIQEASVKKEKLKEEKDLIGKYSTKIMSKAGGKRSVQALAREGYLNKPYGQGKRAGLEALARNGLLKINRIPTGKRAGLEALARNGYLNKCLPNSQTHKRGLSILAKNGLMPVKSVKKDSSDNSRRYSNDVLNDYSNLDDESGSQDFYYNARPRPYLSYFAKRPFLGHRISSASATTRNIPFVERDVRVIPSEEKRDLAEEELQDPYNYQDNVVQKRYVAALLKEASQPAKINIRGAPKSVDEEVESAEGTEEQPGHNGSKRGLTGENSINDEYTMPVMQNSASRDVDEVINELTELSNSKRYYAVKGGGRILGGRLQELGKQKHNAPGHRGFL